MNIIIPVFFLTVLQTSPTFKEKQLEKPRVKAAYQEKEGVLKNRFKVKGISYEGFSLFIRALKTEKIVEAWVKEKGAGSYQLLETYPFCSTSGELGPKRKEGDLQIPEGVYELNHFNPESNFHLSLGVSYPNASDKRLSDPKSPGGAIYIHGNCVTIGCIPITDDKIKELYVLAVEARNNGQKKIPIHIFPGKLDDNAFRMLLRTNGETHHDFWNNLKPIFDDFEKTFRLRNISIDEKGQYTLL